MTRTFASEFRSSVVRQGHGSDHLRVTLLPARLIHNENKYFVTSQVYNTDHAVLVIVTVGGVSGLVELTDTFPVPPFFPRPHLTGILSPSMSSPCAQASAARSADVRFLKLTKAHLRWDQLMAAGLKKSGCAPRLCYVNHRLEL